MKSHLHLALLGMYKVQPSAVKNAAVTAASLLGTGRRRYWEVDMPKLHEDGKDEILGIRERERERERARREELSFYHQFRKDFSCALGT